MCTGARGTRRFASAAICRRSPPTHPYWGAERSGSSSSRVIRLARVLRPGICRCCPEEREPPGSVWIHRNGRTFGKSRLDAVSVFFKASVLRDASSVFEQPPHFGHDKNTDTGTGSTRAVRRRRRPSGEILTRASSRAICEAATSKFPLAISRHHKTATLDRRGAPSTQISGLGARSRARPKAPNAKLLGDTRVARTPPRKSRKNPLSSFRELI